MKTIQFNCDNEIVIKNSRFICYLIKISNKDITPYIDKIKNMHPKATHYCYGYIYNDIELCSDDGEPHGTAGQPMLNVVLHSDVGELTVVVTRYFGGILLGTGGLVKAYQDSVKMNLDALKTTNMVLMTTCVIEIEHSLITLTQRLIKRLNIVSLNEEYTDKVSYTLDVPKDALAEFKAELESMSSGRASLKILD